MKKLFSFVCALVCAMSLSAAKTIYLNTGGSDLWEQGGAVFVEGVSDKDMTAVDGAFGYYQVSVDDSQTTVKFLRMKGDKSAQWNATAELTIPTDGKDCYTITGWDDNDGNWSKYTTPGPVDPSSIVYSIKHPWGGGSWAWKALTPNGDGTYSIRDIYGKNGCNWKSTVSGEKYIANPTLVGNPVKGDSAIFTLTSTEGDGAITITKIVSAGGEGGEGEGEGGGSADPSGTEYWYFDEHNTGWNGTIDNKWKMTVSGDIAYVKVPAGDANKFKIFPCNPKVDDKVLANDDNIAGGALAGDIALLKDTEQWKNILIGKTSAEYFVVLYLPNTTTNNSAEYLVAAMTQLPNSGSDPTALTNTEVENAVVKVIRNGQVLIVREGVTYNMMGQTIQ